MGCSPKTESKNKTITPLGVGGRGCDLKELAKPTCFQAPLGLHSQSLGFFTYKIRVERR